MHSHVYYKLQVKISFLAIWAGTIFLLQAFINFVSAAENKRPKLCQFYASKRELTPVSHFHLPDASHAKSITCIDALSESVNWYFFPTFRLFLSKNQKNPHFFMSERQNQQLFLSQNFINHST